MVMPAGASPIEAFISIRLKEPLRSEPQIATTLAIACPVGWKAVSQPPWKMPPGGGPQSAAAPSIARRSHPGETAGAVRHRPPTGPREARPDDSLRRAILSL